MLIYHTDSADLPRLRLLVVASCVAVVKGQQLRQVARARQKRHREAQRPQVSAKPELYCIWSRGDKSGFLNHVRRSCLRDIRISYRSVTR